MIDIGVDAPYAITINGEDIVEHVAANAYDEYEECAESFLSYVSREEYDILTERMTKVFNEWLEETNNKPDFSARMVHTVVVGDEYDS